MNKGLGRRPSFDERSRNFPIRALIRGASPLRSYTWSCPIYLDQGFEGACTGFAFTHEAAARPVKVPNVSNSIARGIYKRAQDLDEWPGDNYSGTSILAAVKAAMERGWYTSYRWAFGIEDVCLALGYSGPVVLGINWYDSMGETDRRGFLQVTGNDRPGGHAILATGVNVKQKFVRLHNSWGPGWGLNGDCFITFADLDRLLHEEGEACVPQGRKLPLLTRITGAILNGWENFA